MELKKEIDKIKKTLRVHGERISQLEKEGSRLFPEQIGVGGIEQLAKKTDIKKEKIRDCFDLEENILTVIKTLGDDDNEKTKNISLLCLLGYKYFFRKKELLSQEIRRNVAENGVPLDNFASHLKEMMPLFVRRKGKPRSPKTTYRLTTLGEAEAKKLLKNLCKRENG